MPLCSGQYQKHVALIMMPELNAVSYVMAASSIPQCTRDSQSCRGTEKHRWGVAALAFSCSLCYNTFLRDR